MSVPYNSAGFELKFLGVMNGGSTSHTNAFFFPEKDVLAIVDLSLLNVEKAKLLVTPNLKRVILFLTHLHDDHVTGVLKLAFYIKNTLSNVLLEVMTGSTYTDDAVRVLYAMGGRPVMRNGKMDEVLRVFGWLFGGDIVTMIAPKHWADPVFMVSQNFVDEDRQFVRPDWLAGVVPTIHSPRQPGAAGFVFLLNDKAVVYSGDTERTEPFFSKAESYAAETGDHAPVPTELYLEMQTGEVPMHLSWEKTRTSLMRLMRQNTALRVALMHYNDRNRLAQEVEQFNAELGDNRLFLAEEV